MTQTLGEGLPEELINIQERGDIAQRAAVVALQATQSEPEESRQLTPDEELDERTQELELLAMIIARNRGELVDTRASRTLGRMMLSGFLQVSGAQQHLARSVKADRVLPVDGEPYGFRAVEQTEV